MFYTTGNWSATPAPIRARWCRSRCSGRFPSMLRSLPLWSSCQLLISSRAGLSVLKEKTAACYICKEDLLDSLVFVTAAAAQEHRQAKCGAPQLRGKPALGERYRHQGLDFFTTAQCNPPHLHPLPSGRGCSLNTAVLVQLLPRAVGFGSCCPQRGVCRKSLA